MSDADKLHGSINQALYFARLLAEQAGQVDEALCLASDDGQFNRQQLQCFCEASLDALYRGFYFLAQVVLPASQALPRAGGVDEANWQGLLAASQQEHPSPLMNELQAAIQPGLPLASMLAAYAELWQCKKKRPAAGEIKLAETPLDPADCMSWYTEMVGLHARMHEQGAEY